MSVGDLRWLLLCLQKVICCLKNASQSFTPFPFFASSVVIYRLHRWKRPVRSPSAPWQHKTVLQQAFIMVLFRLVSHDLNNEVSATSPGRAVIKFIPLTHRKASPHFLQPLSSFSIHFFPFYALMSIYREIFPSVMPIPIAFLVPRNRRVFKTTCAALYVILTIRTSIPFSHSGPCSGVLFSNSSLDFTILSVNHWPAIQKRYCRCDHTRQELLPPLVRMLPFETHTQTAKRVLPAEGTRDSLLI